ncbi:MAG: tyrosine--tRNA ligase [Candidatus Moranbacteria bacterium]|nr:tyrosine--tRNA ligase [Candidatus Moranbacteria bacterium]
MINTDPKKIDELLSRGVTEVIDREHLRERLLSGEKLRIKLGIDPTSPNLHIGRAVLLLKLRDFQELGHQVVLIIGTFTGIIGDTSDKEAERPMIDEEVLKANMESYAKQAGLILDMSQVELRYNGDWLSKLGFAEIGKQADAFSLAEFMARENIAKRYEAGKRISLRELLYPLMQGYDSVAIEADVELGGTDQRFNLLAGRHLQPMYNQKPQDILMANLILGTDGRKMSSSWGNTINLTDTPNDMFGKIMSVPDELIVEYLVHCTRVPMEEVHVWESKIKAGENPRDAKVFLGQSLVELYHGKEEAEKAVEYFVKTFSKGEIPEDVATKQVVENQTLVDFIVSADLAESKSDARRKIEQGGVSIDGEKLTDPYLVLEKSLDTKVLKVGKKDFVKIVF